LRRTLAALKLLAGVIFAAIFCGIFVVLFNTYHTQSAEAKFERDANLLAGLIRDLKDMGPGSTMSFTIEVPQDCWLKFENTSVVISVGGDSSSFDTFVSLSGPSFSGERVVLTLRRTLGEVQLSG
jgi:hypothetical protein